MPSHFPHRRSLTAALLALAAGAALAPAADAGPRRAQFTYSYTATQQGQWSYDNRLPPGECTEAPARGGGTQSVSVSDRGRVEVTSDLARNVRKGGFNIGHQGAGTFQRQGNFLLELSKRGPCAEPDLALGTAGCGADRQPVSLVINLDRGNLSIEGKAAPYMADGMVSCPFMFISNASSFSSFNQYTRQESSDNDLNGGLLGYVGKVPTAQLFKRKKVVLRGTRTQRREPTTAPALGFVASTTIAWTLTLRPKR